MSLVDALLLDPYPFEVWIAVRTDAKGTGTLNDPYGVSTATQFDNLMNTLPANTRVHLGPGIFKTQGYAVGVTGGWPKAGMRISGAGVDATTLQVLNTGAANTTLFAIGHALNNGAQPNLVDYFELTDLTIDCNLASGTGTGVACGAIRVMGSHVRIQRVKATNWGTKTTSRLCQVIAGVAADPSISVPSTIDLGIVDCIVVQPSASNVGPATAIHIGRKDEVAINAEAFTVGPVIRNCFIDSGWPTATAESRGITMEWCRGAIVEGNQIHNTQLGGPFAGTTSAAATGSIRELVVRDNFYKNVARGLYWKLGGLNPASPQAITSLVRDGTDQSIAVATFNAHGLQQGDRVKMDASAGSPSQFKGYFLVKDATVNTFGYQMTSAPGSDATSPTMQKVFAVNNLLVEGNVIELAKDIAGIIGIHLDDNGLTSTTPDYVNGDIIIRSNHVHYLDGQFGSAYTGYGIHVNGAKNLIVRDNILECAPSNPVRNQRCGSVKYSNNRAPGGALIEGFNPDTLQRYAELETDNDFALIMSLFNRKAS